MSYCPLFFNLKGKSCLIVGGGRVACRRVKKLLRYDMELMVVSPEVLPEIEKKLSGNRIKKTKYNEKFLQDKFMVIAATDNERLNEKIYYQARESGVLANIVHRSDLCEIIFPAVLKKGDLQIAISTSGKSPGLSRKIRQELEGKFDNDYEDILKLSGDIRKMIKEEVRDPEKRKLILNKLAHLINI